MQNPDNQTQQCRTCRARIGEPCKTRGGDIAGKVHWGRGSYRERRQRAAERPRSVYQGKPSTPVTWYQPKPAGHVPPSVHEPRLLHSPGRRDTYIPPAPPEIDSADQYEADERRYG